MGFRRVLFSLLAAFLLPVFCLGCGGGGCGPVPKVPADSNLSGRCQQANQACNRSDDCCGALTCNANKVCSDGVCQAAGTRCGKDSDCCGKLVCNGYCQ